MSNARVRSRFIVTATARFGCFFFIVWFLVDDVLMGVFTSEKLTTAGLVHGAVEKIIPAILFGAGMAFAYAPPNKKEENGKSPEM